MKHSKRIWFGLGLLFCSRTFAAATDQDRQQIDAAQQQRQQQRQQQHQQSQAVQFQYQADVRLETAVSDRLTLSIPNPLAIPFITFL